MFADPERMREFGALTQEPADLVRNSIMKEVRDEVERLHRLAWGHGDEIAKIGDEKFRPAFEQTGDAGEELADALEIAGENTVKNAEDLRDADDRSLDLGNDLANNMPGGGRIRT
ncbi:hypothetical protein ACFOVU_09175 [Nocardiopsis sediminis]|uniref:WXG100 family type VII secretion target n=1 Tax=Nocardiopsis sediminis TaxID=1778267 RepID=A0ABV8FL91_9ACTN